jgi:hypothetical protein
MFHEAAGERQIRNAQASGWLRYDIRAVSGKCNLKRLPIAQGFCVFAAADAPDDL